MSMHTWDRETDLFAHAVIGYAIERLRLPKDPQWGAMPAGELAAADAGMSSSVAGVAGGGMAGIAEGMRIGNAMVHGNISTPSLPRINESPASVRAATTPVSQGGNTFVGGGGGGGRSSGGGRKADVDSILSQVEDYGLIHVLTEGNN
jgi:hypothetical protein